MNALDLAGQLAAGGQRISVEIMIFAFTDVAIGKRLEEVARYHSNIEFFIIADWSQGSPTGPSQVHRLDRLGLPNLSIRYVLDDPYAWDGRPQRVRWNYGASNGLFHHKTLHIYSNGDSVYFLCGSFNWTNRASRSYENQVIWRAEHGNCVDLPKSFGKEFRAIWHDDSVSADSTGSREHFLNCIRAIDNGNAGSSEHGNAQRPYFLDEQVDGPVPAIDLERSGVVAAFSSCGTPDGVSGFGYHPANTDRWFQSRRGSRPDRRAHVSVTNLSLEVIETSQPGEELCVAMYAISRRMPEYERLLEAARRGVKVRCLVDKQTCGWFVLESRKTIAKQALPMKVKASGRMMHQKYVLNASTGCVAVGTANMTIDSINRHAENRILVWRNKDIADQFKRDFSTIWGRLITAKK